MDNFQILVTKEEGKWKASVVLSETLTLEEKGRSIQKTLFLLSKRLKLEIKNGQTK